MLIDLSRTTHSSRTPGGKWTLAGAALVATLTTAACGQSWVHDSFKDFSAGQLDAAGQNLYVSRDGSVRTIHQFDLNDDGAVDLLFNNTHDLCYEPSVTVASWGEGQAWSSHELSVPGARRVVSADLNRDGFNDLVFGPDRTGTQTGRRFIRIAWGDRDGWSNKRLGPPLTVQHPADVSVADLNADGWPDLVAPLQKESEAVVFWGGAEGYTSARRGSITLPSNSIASVAADFDGDGGDDVAVLLQDGTLVFLWSTLHDGAEASQVSTTLKRFSSPAQTLALGDVDGDAAVDVLGALKAGRIELLSNVQNRSWSEPRVVSALSATDITLADLDGDTKPDLVLSNLAAGRALGGEQAGAAPTETLKVLWGSEHGFDAGSTTVEVPFARATAVGDLDGDGRADLAVAVYQGAQRFATDSAVFWGRADRTFARSEGQLPTSGASDVAIVRPTDADPPSVVFANSVAGTIRERVPLQLYWGTGHGFDVERVTSIPFTSGYEASAADLNADGYVDLLAMNSGHGGMDNNPTLGANLYWGSARGLGFDEPLVLREEQLASSNVADLNRDGYLDLIFGAFGRSGGSGADLTIYYGSQDGYLPKNKKQVALPGRSIAVITGDFNRDDWLDIAVAGYTNHAATILWGGAEGFDADRSLDLAVAACIEVEAADLNADGWLDLLASSYNDPGTEYHDMGTTIFWGGPDGFSPAHVQWLPGFTPLGLTVADFDSDGYLDYFSPHYHGNASRDALTSYLFWGGSSGFDVNRRTSFVLNSAADALAGDFNADGQLDLAIACHTERGDHSTDSKVFFNDGRRFSEPYVIDLPTHGPHWMYLQDMGHIADRSWRQTYISPVMAWDTEADHGTMSVEAWVGNEASLRMETRSASNEDVLVEAPWKPATSDGFVIETSDRCLQYRAVFMSNNGSQFPILKRVSLELRQ